MDSPQTWPIIEAAAVDIGQTIYEAVLPFAKELEKAGRSGGSGYAKGVVKGAEPAARDAVGLLELQGAAGSHR